MGRGSHTMKIKLVPVQSLADQMGDGSGSQAQEHWLWGVAREQGIQNSSTFAAKDFHKHIAFLLESFLHVDVELILRESVSKSTNACFLETLDF